MDPVLVLPTARPYFEIRTSWRRPVEVVQGRGEAMSPFEAEGMEIFFSAIERV